MEDTENGMVDRFNKSSMSDIGTRIVDSFVLILWVLVCVSIDVLSKSCDASNSDAKLNFSVSDLSIAIHEHCVVHYKPQAPADQIQSFECFVDEPA